jgi:glucokinase
MGKTEYTVGIDLGGTKILAALVDDKGAVKGEIKTKTLADRGPEEVINRLLHSVENLLTDHQMTTESVAALGMGAPGMVDIERAEVISAPNMQGWQNILIGDILKNRLDIPVYVGNDVNMGLLGEFYFGAAQGYKDVIGVFVGTGIGGALIINGQIITGTHHMAGEIGHMVISKKSKKALCGCGNTGCFEAFGSKIAIARKIDSAIKKGDETSLPFNDIRSLKSNTLKKAVKKQDDLVIKIIRKASKDIGIGIANLLNILDPELVVVGGGVIESLGDFMLPLIQNEVIKNTISYEQRNTKIVESQLGDHAVVIGAASYARHQLMTKENV